MNHIELGRIGERLVTSYLEERDYRIAAKNFRVGKGEIDIIAVKEDTLAFVEVKTRRHGSFGRPGEAVDYYKQQHIIYAAECFLQQIGMMPETIRFDVAEVFYGDEDHVKINYIPDAFTCRR